MKRPTPKQQQRPLRIQWRDSISRWDGYSVPLFGAPEMTKGALKVSGYIDGRITDESHIQIGQVEIATNTGQGTASVERAFAFLVGVGLLVEVRAAGKGSPTIYAMNLPAWSWSADSAPEGTRFHWTDRTLSRKSRPVSEPVSDPWAETRPAPDWATPDVPITDDGSNGSEIQDVCTTDCAYKSVDNEDVCTIPGACMHNSLDWYIDREGAATPSRVAAAHSIADAHSIATDDAAPSEIVDFQQKRHEAEQRRISEGNARARRALLPEPRTVRPVGETDEWEATDPATEITEALGLGACLFCGDTFRPGGDFIEVQDADLGGGHLHSTCLWQWKTRIATHRRHQSDAG